MPDKPTEFILERLEEYSRDAVIAELRRVADLEPEGSFTIEKFQQHSRCNIGTVRRHLESWGAALTEAGLSERYGFHGAFSEKTRSQVGKRISKDVVLQDIRSIAVKLGLTTLTIEQFNANTPYTAGVVRKHFGTFSNALLLAGLQVGANARRYTSEQCFENLLRVWTHYGRPPTYKEMSESPSVVGGKAYAIRWKTWNRALHAFVKYAEGDSVPPLVSNPIDGSAPNTSSISSETQRPAEEKREIRLGLRYAVLRRDAFTCKSCGRSPATTMGIELHIDHITPFSKGGLTAIENLQTLCSDCNIGKGDKC